VRRGTAGSRSQLWVRKEEAEAEAEATNEWRKRRRPRFARLFIYSRIDSSRSIGDERPGEVGL